MRIHHEHITGPQEATMVNNLLFRNIVSTLTQFEANETQILELFRDICIRYKNLENENIELRKNQSTDSLIEQLKRYKL